MTGAHSPRSNSGGGGMLTELTTASPNGPNGYQQQASPGGQISRNSRSPNVAHGNHSLSTSPAPTTSANSSTNTANRPNLKVVIPGGQSGGSSLSNAHRALFMNQGQHTARTTTLSTPVVSLATPSNPGLSAYPSALPSTFQHNEFQLSSSELHGLAGFNPATASMLGVGTWPTGPLPPTACNLRRQATGHLAISTGNSQHVTIKSEPMSPQRDSHTPSSHQSLQSGHSHTSPHGSSDSQTGNGECDGPSSKRQRVEEWSS